MNKLNIPKEQLISNSDMTKFVEDVLSDFYKDKDLVEFAKSYNFSDEELRKGAIKIAQVLDDKKLCQNCRGLSKCVKKDRVGTTLKLVYNSYTGEIDNRFIFCDYKKKWENYLRNVVHSSINPENARESYNRILTFVKNSQNTKSQLKNLLAESIPLIKNKGYKNNFVKGFYVVSPNSNGRTFLQYVLISAMMNNNKVAYVSSPSLFIPLTDKVKSEARDYAIETYSSIKDVDVLLIDDFGLEPKSFQIRDFYLVPLLNERRKKGLITFISSRLTIDEVTQAYCLRDKITQNIMTDTLKYLMSEREIIEPELFE